MIHFLNPFRNFNLFSTDTPWVPVTRELTVQLSSFPLLSRIKSAGSTLVGRIVILCALGLFAITSMAMGIYLLYLLHTQIFVHDDEDLTNQHQEMMCQTILSLGSAN